MQIKISGQSNPSRKKLLFTGGGGAGTEALNRLLGSRYEVHFADADIEMKPYSIEKNCWHHIPFAMAPDFIDELLALCKHLGVDVLIPGVDEELLVIAQSRGKFACDILLPQEEFIRVHLDKLATNEALKSHGLPAPLTEILLTQKRSLSFPCIVKPRHGRGSRGVAIVRNNEELQAHVLLSRLPPEDFIVQELLKGQEYTVMMLANKQGQLRAVVPVKVGLKKGITIKAEIDHDDVVMKACIAIHRAMPISGVYNIQLIKTAEGEAKPFEINPRISTTSCMSIAAGVDFIDSFLDEPEVMADAPLLPFADGIKLRRSWLNEID